MNKCIKEFFLFLSFIVLQVSCGGSSSPSIIGHVDASQGCGEFNDNGSAVGVITSNNCPFDLATPFILKQNGCQMVFENMATDGSTIYGIVDENGDVGFEIISTDENNALYECTSDVSNDSSYIECKTDNLTCLIAGGIVSGEKTLTALSK